MIPDALPTREEIVWMLAPDLSAADRHQHGWACKVCTIVQADKILARLRPAWERMEHVIAVTEREAITFRMRLHEVEQERDALRVDLRACVEALDRAMDAAYEDNWAPSDRWRAAKAALARPGVQAARKETR